mmetsp:Transcript_24184/g.60228  ORF Transcript_24184/g.60228 Transcript_24184/m.60228 type:complete len:93 (+) Transcript_24184:507-785(+)
MDEKEVVSACCVGCGATRKLLWCSKCHRARFCGAACMKRMWPEHKGSCKRWRAADGEAASSSHGQCLATHTPQAQQVVGSDSSRRWRRSCGQ